MQTDSENLHRSLSNLRRRLPEVVRQLQLTDEIDLSGWMNVLDTKLLPRIDPEFPLLVAVCGGGSTGKSTLFNSIIGCRLSAVAGKAGLTRRVLAAGHGSMMNRDDFLGILFEPFGCIPLPLTSAEDLIVTGPPVYVASDEINPNYILIDTPDFDTGSSGQYDNRDSARQVLEAADVLVFIFTNATYNNLDGQRFVSRMLTQIGRKKCVLVYRVYDSFTDEEVIEHAHVLAQNLYGDDFADYVLGYYRTSDCNEVASGDRLMELKPVDTPEHSLNDLLGRLTPRDIRGDYIHSALADAVQTARNSLEQCRLSHEKLLLYTDMCKVAKSRAVADSISSIPLHDIVAYTHELWCQTSPGLVKGLRRMGNIAGSPVKWLKNRFSQPLPEKTVPEDPGLTFESDCLKACNRFRSRLLDQTLSVNTTATDPNGAGMIRRTDRIRKLKDLKGRALPLCERASDQITLRITAEAHPAADEFKGPLTDMDWNMVRQSVEQAAGELGIMPEAIKAELKDHIIGFRGAMGRWNRYRETLFASLNAIPSALAVVYIFTTGDAVAGGTILAKISGLFGMHDLAALIALPVSTGLNEADRLQLQRLIRPVAEKWLEIRKNDLSRFFDTRISGDFFINIDKRCEQLSAMLESVENMITDIIHTGASLAHDSRRNTDQS